MKKSKCILTTLTATVFAMSVGALVACGDSSDGETKVGVYEITFDANGGAYANGNTVKLHTADGRILAEPTAPEYTGFVFTGYNVKRDGSGETVTFGANGYKFSGATTVYAQWEAQRQDGVYNITFDANGGTIVGNSVLKTTGGKLASLISETYLSYGGHTFDGWYTLKDGGDLVTVNYVFTGDATVYAHWTKDSGTEEPTGVYTVTFDPNGGTIANTTAQTLNGLLASLPTPTAPLNHTFDGWYTAATGGVRITATYEFTVNTTVYAHYTKDGSEVPSGVYTVTFDANGGTLAGGGTAQTSNGMLAELPTPVAPQGKVFVGWFTAIEGGDRVTTAYEFDRDTTLYAVYEDAPQEITYDFYLYGTVGGEDISSLTKGHKFTESTPDKDVWKQFKAVIKLSVGDEIKIYRHTPPEGFDSWGYNNYESDQWAYGKYEVNADGYSNFIIKQAGTFTFHLKLYDNRPVDGVEDGDSIWVEFVPEIVEEEVPVTKLVYNDVEYELTDNTENIKREDEDGNPINIDQVFEFLITDVELYEGGTISFTVNGKVERVFVDAASKGLDVSVHDEALAKINVSVTGKYMLYLKKWSNANGATWGVYGEKTGDILTQEVGAQTITFVAGEGTLETSDTLVTDVDGRLKSLPEPIAPVGMEFDGWYTAKETGGEKISTATVFTQATTVYARYTEIEIPQVGGVYRVGENGALAELTLKTLTDQEVKDGITKQFMLENVQFAEGDKIYFIIDGNPVSLNIESSSSGVETPAGNANEYVTVKRGGKFTIYIKHYETHDYWTVHATRTVDPSEITNPADTVRPNNAYLIGSVQNSDATWENSATKGFEMTLTENGLYMLEIALTADDNIKFYKTGATLAADRIWVGNIASKDVGEYLAVVDSNIAVFATGNYKFLVDFNKNAIYVTYSATGTPADPVIPAEESDFYLVGNINGENAWSSRDYNFVKVAATDSAKEQYELVVEFTQSSDFKVHNYVTDKWINNMHGGSEVKPSGSDNLTLGAGKYKIILQVWADSSISIKIENVAA
ncbi:InlB B-repeat-containing protein [Anaerocaecibacter muris]|uniref:InlB B-repeat-containing protein n=1 Tax=Anaerocaecibacter muris TaxID=2941513 RepID=UPI003F6925B6